MKSTREAAEQRGQKLSGMYGDDSENPFADETASAVTRTDNGLSILNFEASAAGMVIPSGTSDAQLQQLEDVLFTLEDGVQLHIGDYLVAVDNREYGETKAIALRKRRDPDTLYKWKSICKAVSIFLRRKVLAAFPDAKPLTLTHYEIVMALSEDDQAKWLNAAVNAGWSTRHLSAEIAKAQLPAEVKVSANNAQAETADSPSGDIEEFIPITTEEETAALIDPGIPKDTVKIQRMAQQNRYHEIDTTILDRIETWLANLRKKVARAKVEALKPVRGGGKK